MSHDPNTKEVSLEKDPAPVPAPAYGVDPAVLSIQRDFFEYLRLNNGLKKLKSIKRKLEREQRVPLPQVLFPFILVSERHLLVIKAKTWRDARNVYFDKRSKDPQQHDPLMAILNDGRTLDDYIKNPLVPPGEMRIVWRSSRFTAEKVHEVLENKTEEFRALCAS